MNLIDAGIKVTIKYNINRLTYHKLPEYVTWIYSTFPDSTPWVLCNIDICGIAMNNQKYTAVSFSDSKPFVEKTLDKVIEYNLHGEKRTVHLYNTPLCCIDPYYWSFLRKAEGGIMAALRLPYEKKEDNRLKLNVKGDGGAVFESCRQCALQKKCPGTWYETGMFYKNIFTPFKFEG
jgi:hypothetical protein